MDCAQPFNVLSYPFLDFDQPFNDLSFPFMNFSHRFNMSSYPFLDFHHPFNDLGHTFKRLWRSFKCFAKLFTIRLQSLYFLPFKGKALVYVFPFTVSHVIYFHHKIWTSVT